jgi:hypothetical protein
MRTDIWKADRRKVKVFENLGLEGEERALSFSGAF